MILKPFFRRHFIITAAVFLVLLTISSYLSTYLNRLDRAEYYKTQGETYVNAVEKREDKLAYVKELNSITKELAIPVEMDLIRDGKSLLSGQEKKIPSQSDLSDHRTFVQELNLPEPATLTVKFIRATMPRRAVSWTFIVMWASILIGSTLSIFMLFWSMRDRAEMAKEVLTAMQKGDLKARFPTTKLDEIGQLMVLFNQMADEIERLVEQLKQNEKHRLHLLQELTHDLRTPVASLRNLIETLRFEDSRLEAKAKVELTDLAYQETEYLTRLVEDLLFLALVLEPKYKAETGEVMVKELITAQLAASSTHYPKVQHHLNGKTMGRMSLTGNSHLLKRLFRNAFENAFSFARTKVDAEIQLQNGVLTISIRDDGPGLTDDSLETFGKKRSTRYHGQAQEGGRLSVGLGSVIIQAIAVAHGGHAVIRNRHDDAGRVAGAELLITLRGEVPA